METITKNEVVDIVYELFDDLETQSKEGSFIHRCGLLSQRAILMKLLIKVLNKKQNG
jgi:hypothetical protein